MRILYLITYYLPHLSGLTRGLQPIAEAMAGAGHQVTVLAARHEDALPQAEVIDGVKVTRVPVAARIGKGLVMPGHALAAWRACGQADIVHLILPQADAGLAALAARLRGRKVVLSYVCSFSAPGVAGAFMTFLLRLSHLLAGMLAHRIVALSPGYAQQSGFCRLFRHKLAFIPVPVPHYPPNALARRAPTPPYRIGFVGRIAAEKNLGLLLDALPLLRDALGAPFTLEIAGPTDMAKSAPQRQLLERLRAETAPELRMLGVLDEAALDAFYRDIDLLVLPSTDRIEAYGMVQVEAMLRGTPCVTSDRPGMREPIDKTGFGRLFPPGDANGLACAMADGLTVEFDVKPEAIHAVFDPAAVHAAFRTIYCGLLETR
jgi:glycosyltransferase involved in cell wall biosynthesis